jgi:hypothetical protein
MRKISTIIKGGLGNQFFQYSASLAIQKKFKDLHSLDYFIGGNTWSNKGINIDYFFHDIKLNSFSNIQRLFFSRYNFFIKKIIDNQSLIYLDKINNYYSFFLNGYFQNSSWYKSVIEEVCKKIIHSTKKIYNDFEKNELVIAFRRSDYIQLGIEIKFDYYLDALRYFNKKKNLEILVVSEDEVFNTLLSNNLKYLGYKVKIPDKKIKNYSKALIDLFSIIKSDNLIISNSSFNWWGAAIRKFCSYDSSRVVVPKNWYPKKFNDNHPGLLHDWSTKENNFN